MNSKKAEREPAAQAIVKNADNAPQGANTVAPPVQQKQLTKRGTVKNLNSNETAKSSDGKLFVVKDMISGHIYSDPLPEAKAKAKLALVDKKEKKEHPEEADYQFELVPFNSDEDK